MGKIIAAVPYWESDPEKRAVLFDCLASLKGQDETFVLAGKQPTLPIAWNMCLDLSFGMGADYVVLLNDDVILMDGDLKQLCVPDTVTSPLINGTVWKKFHAHVFGLPKTIYDKVGKMDERFQCYWADTDYAKRLVDANIPVETIESVNFMHKEAARTLKHLQGLTEGSDRDKFVEKWGREWFDPTMGR
jgi:hypothetical protein